MSKRTHISKSYSVFSHYRHIKKYFSHSYGVKWSIDIFVKLNTFLLQIFSIRNLQGAVTKMLVYWYIVNAPHILQMICHDLKLSWHFMNEVVILHFMKENSAKDLQFETRTWVNCLVSEICHVKFMWRKKVF